MALGRTRVCSQLPLRLSSIPISLFSLQLLIPLEGVLRTLGKAFVPFAPGVLQYTHPILPNILAQHWGDNSVGQVLAYNHEDSRLGSWNCNKARHDMDLSSQSWAGGGRRITGSYWAAQWVTERPWWVDPGEQHPSLTCAHIWISTSTHRNHSHARGYVHAHTRIHTKICTSVSFSNIWLTATQTIFVTELCHWSALEWLEFLHFLCNTF